jgi:N-acetylmuramoyl-L-alanine amidase
MAMAAVGPAPGFAQTSDALVVRGPDGASLSVPVTRARGYATVTHEALRQLGWAVEVEAPQVRARLGSAGPLVEFWLDSPLFSWDEELLQMVNVPFRGGGSIQIPLQFIVDFLPDRASEAYAFSSDDGTLRILDASLWPDRGSRSRSANRGPSGRASRDRLVDPRRTEDRRGSGSSSRSGDSSGGVNSSGSGDSGNVGEPSSTNDQSRVLGDQSAVIVEQDFREAQNLQKRVIVIDPGHGGTDPGATGSGGRREKDIALAIGRYLERELRGNEDFEVYLTRDRDVLVDLWGRGDQATDLKGDRHGLFISLHVNSNSSPSIRGFETYILSEARTDDERRMAAIENAPLEAEAALDGSDVDDVDLNFILGDLRNTGYQPWSLALAEGIQAELEVVHPGPNRGVKQGPFAVITNAVMPAVLVEIGFISNREEERVLSRAEFQRGVAGALAQAIRGFFEQYPPGQGISAQSLAR